MTLRRVLIVVLAAALLLAGGAAFRFHARLAQSERQLEVARANARVVAEFLSLEHVPLPNVLSDYWLVRSAERFEDAPIQLVLYGDPLCSDCRVLFEQMQLLEQEFAGQMNVLYYFFPLEARCNDVVEKDKHPGACDLSYMMAADPERFRAIHDEVLSNMDSAKVAGWRARLAERHGVTMALTDTAVQSRVHALMRTGAAYPPTSSKYAHGIRSTPTLILNGRMIIGTLPLPQLRAIFQALVDASRMSDRRFMESWINPGCSTDSEAVQCRAE